MRPSKRSPSGSRAREAPKNDSDVPPPSLLATDRFPIVGVGASAGGLDAFVQFLQRLDPKTGMAFVLVQHLDPKHPSLLSEILAKSTAMPLVEAVDGMVLKADHIYVMPPNVGMVVASQTLKLSPRQNKLGEGHYPIDEFFNSLAQEQKDYAVGIVLSGTGSDGANGVAAIVAEGGVAIAQDPKSAKFDAMPLAAIASGVDFVLDPAAIAIELARLALSYRISGDNTTPGGSYELAHMPVDVQSILALLRIAKGVDFAAYKRPTVLRRIHRRMSLHNLVKVDEYVNFLKINPAEVDALYEDILIKVTSFFRNTESWKMLQEHVFPKILSDKSAATSVRVWVPGCATGEEAYSMAICLLEALQERGISRKIEIFATDISQSALAHARLGKYDGSIAQDVSPERLNRYFSKDGAHYQVVTAVRECCVFAKQNLARDPPFSKLDLISCCNLLIYFNPQTQKQILATFHFALKADGFLSLGSAEALGASRDLFGAVSKNAKIFTKKSMPRGAVIPSFPGDGLELKINRDVPPANHRREATHPLEIKSDADRAILKFVSPGVVVNEQLEISQFRGNTSAFLSQPSGEPTTHIQKMCRPGLLVELRTAIQAASESGASVKRDISLPATVDQVAITASIDVIPFTEASSAQRGFIILFAQKSVVAGVISDERSVGPMSEVSRLERDLSETKDYLNSIIENEQATNKALKAAGEEVLSANEELQSASEEMATAKEEIQATNEELVTVIEELNNRNKELADAHNDLANLFGCAQIPIVLLSANMAVRRFTPPAAKVLELSEKDLGRSLTEFGSRLKVDGLSRLASEVLESLNTKEEDVQDRDGKWYSLRIKPYRTINNKIDGTVISLVDIDNLKRSFDRLKQANEYAEAIIKTVPSPLLILDSNLRVVTANQFFCSHFRVKKEETEGVEVYDLGNGQWCVPELKNLLEEILPKDELIESYVVDHDFPKIGRRVMQLSARKLIQDCHEPAKILLAFHDITAERRAEEDARLAKEASEAANQAKSDFLANMSHEIRTPIGAILGYSELLVNPKQSPAEVLQSATHIRHNVTHLIELIDEILDIAKIEAGMLEVERVRFELLPELAEAFDSLQIRAHAKGLEFIVNFSGDIPESIFACPKRLRQILANVGGNALKFTERGSIEITVRLLPPADMSGAPHLCFDFKDTGVGLSLAQQQRLFQPFSQADSSVTRKFGGTGLGLALSRRLALAMGGDVVLTDSQVGMGSTFTLTIDSGPLSDVRMVKGLTKSILDRSKKSNTEYFTANNRLTDLRVLLVEDGPDIQMLLSEFLSSSGAVVELAINGAEAIEKAEMGDHDVVLMDIQMPVLDGYEATKRLRAAGYQTPIIALTAHAMYGEREKCLAAGCNEYMSKPINPNLLIQTIEDTVKKKVLDSIESSGRSLLALDPVVGPLVSAFVSRLPERMHALKVAEGRADWRNVANLAHQMAGAAGGYGFPELGKIARSIEYQAIHHTNPPALTQSIAVFGRLCKRVISYDKRA